MKDIEVVQANVNTDLLDAELRFGLPALVHGISRSGDLVIVHLGDSVTGAQVDLARQIVQDHDYTKLTPAQLDAADLFATAAALDFPLLPGSTLEQVAERVAWLEREVRRLIGG